MRDYTRREKGGEMGGEGKMDMGILRRGPPRKERTDTGQEVEDV